MKVSRIALGTIMVGMMPDENEAFKVMDAALEMGINVFDCADRYDGTRKRRS